MNSRPRSSSCASSPAGSIPPSSRRRDSARPSILLTERSQVPVEVTARPDRRLAAPVEATAYFVVSEALTNVAKYASASHATVSTTCDESSLRVVVADDGIGGADPGRGSGLRGLQDRVAAIGGSLIVESPAGGGTRVVAEIPLPG